MNIFRLDSRLYEFYAFITKLLSRPRGRKQLHNVNHYSRLSHIYCGIELYAVAAINFCT